MSSSSARCLYEKAKKVERLRLLLPRGEVLSGEALCTCKQGRKREPEGKKRTPSGCFSNSGEGHEPRRHRHSLVC